MRVEELEKAVAELSPDEFARFRAWFEEFDTAGFDAQIEAGIASGKLDKLADAALVDFRAGRGREL
jgi:hypothetical protein